MNSDHPTETRVAPAGEQSRHFYSVATGRNVVGAGGDSPHSAVSAAYIRRDSFHNIIEAAPLMFFRAGRDKPTISDVARKTWRQSISREPI